LDRRARSAPASSCPKYFNTSLNIETWATAESKLKRLYLQNIKLERQYPHCETKWMWIGINQLWTILSIDGLTGESGFAKDGAHTDLALRIRIP
jgi:hypothetical protein